MSLQTVQEARLVRAFLCLGVSPCLPLYLPSVYPLLCIPGQKSYKGKTNTSASPADMLLISKRVPLLDQYLVTHRPPRLPN